MRDNANSYGSEDQDNIMSLIDSRDWPKEPAEKKTLVELRMQKVSQIRKIIEELTENKQDVGDWLNELAQAEKLLNEAIDFEKQMEEDNTELPF